MRPTSLEMWDVWGPILLGTLLAAGAGVLLSSIDARLRAELSSVVVRVIGPYAPSTVRGTARRPAQLGFLREREDPCSGAVVFPGIGVSASLPVGREVTVHLPALEPGNYVFTCGRGRLRGHLVIAAA